MGFKYDYFAVFPKKNLKLQKARRLNKTVSCSLSKKRSVKREILQQCGSEALIVMDVFMVRVYLVNLVLFLFTLILQIAI